MALPDEVGDVVAGLYAVHQGAKHLCRAFAPRHVREKAAYLRQAVHGRLDRDHLAWARRALHGPRAKPLQVGQVIQQGAQLDPQHGVVHERLHGVLAGVEPGPGRAEAG